MSLTTKTFSELAVLTRSTAGSFFNSSGVMQSAAINSPRFDFNPATLAANGLLLEPAATNHVTFSEQIDNVSWAKSGSTVTADVAMAPDFNMTADKIVESATTAPHLVSKSITLSNSTTYNFSVFLKAAGRTSAFLSLASNVLSSYSTSIDLVTGAITSNDLARAQVKNCGNGWWRLSGTFTTVASVVGGTALRVYATANLGVLSYPGDGVSGIYCWGAQLEVAATPTSYIATADVTASRGAESLLVSSSTGWKGSNDSFNISADVGVTSFMDSGGIHVTGNGYVRTISYFPNS